MDDARMPFMVGAESLGPELAIVRIVPGTDRAALEFLPCVRQRMRLQFMDHLQLVFDIAKKEIGGSEIIPIFG